METLCIPVTFELLFTLWLLKSDFVICTASVSGLSESGFRFVDDDVHAPKKTAGSVVCGLFTGIMILWLCEK